MPETSVNFNTSPARQAFDRALTNFCNRDSGGVVVLGQREFEEMNQVFELVACDVAQPLSSLQVLGIYILATLTAVLVLRETGK
jgi:hypothetical protein